MTNPHTSDVSPEPTATPSPLHLAEAVDPDYGLGRAAEFLGRSGLRPCRRTALRDLCHAAYHLHRHILREARALGLAVYYSDHNPTVVDPAAPAKEKDS